MATPGTLSPRGRGQGEGVAVPGFLGAVPPHPNLLPNGEKERCRAPRHTANPSARKSFANTSGVVKCKA
jgi:hypothetical protein